MDSINRETLAKKHGDKADALFAEIAMLGGWGEVGPSENQLDPDSWLSVAGVLDPNNKAVAEAAKARIKAIIGGNEAPKVAEAK